MESIYVQETLGSIERDHVEGFERSILSILQSPGGDAWWQNAKVNFNDSFANHVDGWLENHTAGEVFSSLLIETARGGPSPGAAVDAE